MQKTFYLIIVLSLIPALSSAGKRTAASIIANGSGTMMDLGL